MLSWFSNRKSLQDEPSYQRLDSQQDSLLHKEICENCHTSCDERWYYRSWLQNVTTIYSVLCTVVLFMTVAFHSNKIKSSHPDASYENGFSTDLDAVKHSISVLPVMFTGSPQLRLTDHGQDLFVPETGLVKFVGVPSPEIEDAWEKAIANRYFYLSPQEAGSVWGDRYGDLSDFYDPNKGGYIAGLDMFHTLHCLNRLRQEFDLQHYPNLSPLHRIHRDHCIDHIRQQIMCTGDLSPVPTRYNKDLNATYADSNIYHTCRDFTQIRKWVTERIEMQKNV